MRIGKPVAIEDISQTLARSGGAIDAFLKNEQSALLPGGLFPDEVRGVCVASWMKQQSNLCQSHAGHLRQLAPLRFHTTIDEVRTSQDLQAQLEDVLRRPAIGKGSGGGVLGRAAEFLVAQRGINH